jgi:hypothetical protein
MKKDEFATELMMEELKKEQGGFVTQRIIDRLVLLYSPLFDREFLSSVAEGINKTVASTVSPQPARTGSPPEEKHTEEGETAVKQTRRIAAVFSSFLLWLN